MAKYASLFKQKLNTLLAWKIKHVPQDCNERVDALAVVDASLPISPNLLSTGLLNIACPSKLDKGNSPVLDGPHMTIYSHRGTT